MASTDMAILTIFPNHTVCAKHWLVPGPLPWNKLVTKEQWRTQWRTPSSLCLKDGEILVCL